MTNGSGLTSLQDPKRFTAAKATSPQVADFLCHLRSTRDLKCSTLETYLAAISYLRNFPN